MNASEPESVPISMWLRAAREQLENRLEAELLAACGLSKSRAWLFAHGEQELGGDQRAQLDALLARRMQGEPVAYILGQREFWSRPFRVTPAVLIPRPETETVVETALDLSLPAAARVLDLGTGSGCIAITLAAERPGWRVTAIDHSPAALRVAEQNRRALAVDNVELLSSHWYTALADRRFDLIVANPPYIAPDDVHLGLGDVRFEPATALVAGDRGLADIGQIIGGAHEHLRPGGWLVLEHGYDQSDATRRWLEQAGFLSIGTRNDGAGLARVAFGQRAGSR